MSDNVKKRHVLYFSGFDPRGPAFYRRLYRSESIKQSLVSGMPVSIAKSPKMSRLSSIWAIRSDTDERSVETAYEFMRWDDIIRNHWQASEWRIWRSYFRSLQVYIGTGALSKVLNTSWPPFITSLFPLLVLMLLLGLSTVISYVLNVLLAATIIPGWLVTACIFTGAIQIGRLAEKRINSYWLLRIYTFTRKQGMNRLPELEARLDEFAQQIVERAKTDIDELLIVGHSTGTMIAISALARAIAIDPQLSRHGPRISLMTLGHCIPILSFLPTARRFRQELAQVADNRDIDWIDFTAPTDGACFAFTDPIVSAGIRRPGGSEIRPKLLSPRFATLFPPERYMQLKRDWYRNHFQYLMAGELSGEYDYFAITAGDITLAERYRTKSSVNDYRKLKVFS